MSLIVNQENPQELLNLIMELEAIMPEKEGQICKIIVPLEDENPDDVYIVAEDPQPYGREDNIYVVNLRDLQRNVSHPQFVQQIAIIKSELVVIANDLESYIQGWNTAS